MHLCRSVESFFIKDNKDGTYLATWVPSASGNYLLQVYIDGNAVGELLNKCGIS